MNTLHFTIASPLKTFLKRESHSSVFLFVKAVRYQYNQSFTSKRILENMLHPLQLF